MQSPSYLNDELKAILDAQIAKMKLVPIRTGPIAQYKNLTFAEAIRAIDAFIAMDRKTKKTSADDMQLLINIREQLEAFNEQLKLISASDKPIVSEGYSAKTQNKELELYNKQITESTTNLLVQAVKLYSRIEKKLEKEIDENVHGPYTSIEDLAKLHTEQSEEIENNKNLYNLYTLIKNCCFGIVSKINKVSGAYETANSYLSAFIEVVEHSNGVVIPFSQSLDTSLGSELSVNDNIDSAAGCAGYVIDWFKQILEGRNRLALVYDTKTHAGQINNSRDLIDQYNNLDMAAIRNINYIVKKMHSGNIYYLGLNGRGLVNMGHALGVRFIPSTSEYEFFDPNFGIAKFSNEHDFKYFMKIIMNYYAETHSFYEAKIIEIPANGMNQKSFVSGEYPKPSENGDIPINVLHIFFNGLRRAYKIEEERDSLKMNVLAIMKDFLPLISSTVALDTLKKYISDTFPLLFEENNSKEKSNNYLMSFKVFYKRPFSIELEELFNKRLNELNPNGAKDKNNNTPTQRS